MCCAIWRGGSNHQLSGPMGGEGGWEVWGAGRSGGRGLGGLGHLEWLPRLCSHLTLALFAVPLWRAAHRGFVSSASVEGCTGAAVFAVHASCGLLGCLAPIPGALAAVVSDSYAGGGLQQLVHYMFVYIDFLVGYHLSIWLVFVLCCKLSHDRPHTFY